tara:strand:+ start:234 stop:368 length:135 start_codon:yes stop_codon:yes gene_type:complete
MIYKMINSFRQIRKYDDVEEAVSNAVLLAIFAFTIVASVGEIIS